MMDVFCMCYSIDQVKSTKRQAHQTNTHVRRTLVRRTNHVIEYVILLDISRCQSRIPRD